MRDEPEVADLHLLDAVYVHADKSLRALAYYKRAQAKLGAWMASELKKIQDKVAYHEGQLRVAGEIINTQTQRANVPLPNGSVRFVAAKGSMNITDKEAAEKWARETFPGNVDQLLIPQPPRLSATELRSALESQFTETESGDFVDGAGRKISFARIERPFVKSMSYTIASDVVPEPPAEMYE